MQLQEPDKDHFERVLPRSWHVIGASSIAYAILLVWIFVSTPNFEIFLFQAIAALIIIFASFIAGNTYRLKDIRRRYAYKLSQIPKTDPVAKQEAWDKLVPPTTISFRFRVAVVGMAIGTIGQIAIILIYNQNNELITGVVTTFLVIVLAGLFFLAGTYSRPVD